MVRLFWWLSHQSFNKICKQIAKTRSSCFDLCSDPYLWPWILGNDRKNINSGASTKDGGFLRRVHGVTEGCIQFRLRPGQKNRFGASIFEPKVFWEQMCIEEKTCDFSASPSDSPLVMSLVWHFATKSLVWHLQLWNSQSLECRNTSPNWKDTTALVRPCIENAQRKADEEALLAKPTGKRPRCPPRWRNCISDLAWSRLGAEQAELSQIAVDRDVFQILLWMLSPQPSLEEKWAWKWMQRVTIALVYPPVFKSAQLASEQLS